MTSTIHYLKNLSVDVWQELRYLMQAPQTEFDKENKWAILVISPVYNFQKPCSVKTNFEPTFIGLGSKYLAAGTNNFAKFYELTESGFQLVSEFEYGGNVTKIQLNDTYAAACGTTGQLTVHWIDPRTHPTGAISGSISTERADTQVEGTICSITKEHHILPDLNQLGSRITAFQLTEQYLIYATDIGELCHFHLGEWKCLNRHTHMAGIVSLCAQPTGIRVVFVDANSCGIMYNPILDHSITLPDWLASANQIIWDSEESENPLFVAFDDNRLTVFRYFGYGQIVGRQYANRDSVGPSPSTAPKKPSCLEILTGECRAVGVIRIPYGHVPLSVCAAEMCFLSPTGRLTVQQLTTHSFRTYTRALLNSDGTAKTNNIENPLSVSTEDAKERKVGSAKKRATKKDQSEGDLLRLSQTELKNYFDQAMRAGCLDDAWVFANVLNDVRTWTVLGMASLRLIQFDLAIRSFRKTNHPGLVLSIQRIRDIEDEFLLAGYIAMMMKEFDQAQEYFLISTKPSAALEMRCDLLHWEAALQLAKTLSPADIPVICREYALEMECIGDYVNALMHFERALMDAELESLTSSTQKDKNFKEVQWRGDSPVNHVTPLVDKSSWQEHMEICKSGIARNAIRLGDFKRGIQLAKESGSTSILKSCADILEQMKQYPEAASLHEAAESYESSISLYLRCKNYRRAGELLGRVTNAPRLHLQYARAREAEGAYKEAVVAFEAAQDWDSVVRLQLDKLGNVEEATRIVHATKSTEGAKMVAHHFIRINDHASAVKFLVLSKCTDDAFQLARRHRKMEVYADAIGQDASSNEYQSIACYFENEKNWFMAGKFYLLAKKYEKAVRHLLRAPYSENSPALDLALEAVGLAGDTRLTHLLLVYLMGEADGVPKDARHLFRLYMVLKQYKEAARTAVIIAREEQTAGNYRTAHDLLFNLVQELRQRDLRVPSEMADNLALLHSYILAKMHVKHGDHLRAARMLLRVAENISKFPSHVVQILTSTVIECQKAGLKSASFGYAAMLLRPEYRDKLDPKHRRKFETLIRRPDKKADALPSENINAEPDTCTPCPLCLFPLANSSLYCTECRNTLPYCIITGTHVVKSDFTICPNCKFPAIYSEFMSYLELSESPACPMCSAQLNRNEIRRIIDPSRQLNAWINTTEDEHGSNGSNIAN